jgi:hypothetical protein
VAQVGTLAAGFTYDTPVVSVQAPRNGPTSGRAQVSVMGVNFDIMNATPSISLGTTLCRTSSWTSATALVCDGNQGESHSHHTKLRVSLGVLTFATSFSYDAPVLSEVRKFNGASSATSTITLRGSNFATLDVTPSVVVGASKCGTAAWTSITSVLCASVAGSGPANLVSLTVSSHLGTTAAGFTYDAPVVTNTNLPNGATKGGSTLTMAGVNFGVADLSNSVLVGSTLCGSSSWTSLSAVRCDVLAVGDSPARAVAVYATGIAGTERAGFSYDAPVVVAGLLARNSPASGATSVTVSGVNFAAQDLTASLRIGLSACATASWTATTSITCLNPAGSGAGVLLAASVSAVVGTHTGFFTYDSPVISGVTPANAATTAGLSVTIIGSNFASSDVTTSVRVGSSLCATSAWTTQTSVTCQLHDGTGKARNVAVIASGVTGTRFIGFSYNPPTITDINAENAPTSSGALISIAGFDFGGYDSSISARVDSAACASSSWSAHTLVLCRTRATTGTAATLDLEVNAQKHSKLSAFTYDAPTVTQAAQPNAPPTAMSSVTLAGFNFGMQNFTPSLRLGATACGTTAWNSQTSATCFVASYGTGAKANVALSVSGKVGTLNLGFSYDPPAISFSAHVNGATSGGVSVTIHGSNFAAEDASATARIGSTACRTTSWTTLTSVMCSVPLGAGGARRAVVDVDGQAGTRSLAFSYDSPVVAAVVQKNAPTASGAVLTVTGTNFGEAANAPTITVGLTECRLTKWVATSSLECTVPDGAGLNLPVTVNVRNAYMTVLSSFTYNPPEVSAVSPVNAPAFAGAQLTMTGVNFGPGSATLIAQIGETKCATTAWVSDSALVCTSPIGAGSAKAAGVSASLLLGSLGLAFTYDAPVVNGVAAGNAAAVGGAQVVLRGFNLAAVDLTATAFVGSAACETTSWTSATALGCRTGTGYGSARTLSARVGAIGGTGEKLFSFDSPAITNLQARNAPKYGGIQDLTLTGMNFAIVDATATAFIGGTACTTTSWTTNTAVKCSSPTGSDNLGLMRASTGTMGDLYTAQSAALALDSMATGSLPAVFNYNGPGTTVLPSQDLTLGPTYKLTVQLASATSYDQLIMPAGALFLGGTLHLDVVAPYDPWRSTRFIIFQADSIQGTFDQTTSNYPNMNAITAVENQADGTGQQLVLQLIVPGCDQYTKGCWGHGTCDAADTGKCQCNTGYGGYDCSTACFYNRATAQWECGCDGNLAGVRTVPAEAPMYPAV